MTENKIKNKIWLIGGILLVSFFLIFGQGESKPLQPLANFLVKPFARLASGVGFWFNQKISFISNIGELKSENEKLTNENLDLKFKLVQLKEADKENKILREEIGLIEQTGFETEASFVLGHSLGSSRKVVYLDKGSRDGIEEGQPVVVGKGLLVGRISKVFNSTSEAELLLDKNNKINVEIQESGTKGIIQGEFGTSIVMDMVSQSAEVDRGHTVITSGLGGLFPRGLLVGFIKESRPTVDQLFQKFSLDVPVQFKDLRMVWVVTGGVYALEK